MQEPDFLSEYQRLYKLAEQSRESYQSSEPFNNIYFDNFFSRHVYDYIRESFPDSESSIWKTPQNLHTLRKSVTRQGEFKVKEYLFNPQQRRVLMELNSSLFLRFLEILTGISGLIPDPYFAEASYAMSHQGGTLDIHADFSHHDHLKVERRLNILIYLNDGWQESWGGSLNLYDKHMNLKKLIFPVGNRMAVFTTSEVSFHGFPEPICCPADEKRRSINMYYYTVPRANREIKRIFFPSDPNFQNTLTTD